MGTGYGTGEGGRQGAAEVTSKDALLTFFTLVPNAFELSKTPLKGPWPAPPLFYFT